MEKDKIFFGESGLTTTSSNYIANLCKEAYTSLEKQLSNIVLYTTNLKLLGSNEETLLHQGIKTTSNFEESLNKIA